MYSTTVMSCPSGYGLAAEVVNARAQEKVLWVYYGRGTTAWNTSSGPTNSVAQTYYCNGNGTDTYRTQGRGIDNWDRSQYRYSSGVSQTC